MKWDGYSGDYGPNFVGHAIEMGTYLIDHPTFGWQAFGGRVLSTMPAVQVQVRDSIRRRIFLAPIGYLLTVDAGAFSAFDYDPATKSVSVVIESTAGGTTDAAVAPVARLIVTRTANIYGAGILSPPHNLAQINGAWLVPFQGTSATVFLGST